MLQELNVKNLNCPLPLLKAKQALNKMAQGDTLRVLATDAGSVRDFRVFCELSGNVLVESEERDGLFIYLLQKK
jgi:tRNA 2-thiouridine synthesizing protein A